MSRKKPFFIMSAISGILVIINFLGMIKAVDSPSIFSTFTSNFLFLFIFSMVCLIIAICLKDIYTDSMGRKCMKFKSQIIMDGKSYGAGMVIVEGRTVNVYAQSRVPSVLVGLFIFYLLRGKLIKRFTFNEIAEYSCDAIHKNKYPVVLKLDDDTSLEIKLTPRFEEHFFELVKSQSNKIIDETDNNSNNQDIIDKSEEAENYTDCSSVPNIISIADTPSPIVDDSHNDSNSEAPHGDIENELLSLCKQMDMKQKNALLSKAYDIIDGKM